MAKIFPIIVTYNTSYKDCNTYKSLLCHYDNMPMLIYDNSPTPINSEFKTEYVHYKNDPNNGGVSKAYNYGAKIAKEIVNADFVLLLDQDTTFEPNYINILNDAIDKYKSVNLFVPIIRYNDGRIFSPVGFSFWKIKLMELSPGLHSLKNTLPVNSGSCIRIDNMMSVGGYNENIPLDFSDFDFFHRLSKTSDTFYVVDSTAKQSFSNDETDTEKLYERFKKYIAGVNHAAIKHRCIIHVLRHTISLTVRTKDVRFIMHCLKNIF